MKTINDYAELVKEKHALNETIAPVEADETDASKAYAVGEQLILSGILYDVIAPISQHDVITTTGSGANIAPAGPISAKIQTLTKNVDVLIENGAVNKLPNTGTTDTKNGVTATYASDGKVTLNASSASTNISDFPISSTSKPFYLKEGTYVLSGGASADARLYIRTVASASAIAIDSGNGAEFTVTSEMASGGFAVYLNVASGKTFDKVVISPMIADADYTGGYVPYAMTNRELTLQGTPKVWTPKLYDLDTYVMDGTGRLFEIGDLRLATFDFPVPESDVTLSIMLQVRNLPFNYTLAGTIFYPTSFATDMGGTRTVQPTSSAGAYFRPNITGTFAHDAVQSISGFLIGTSKI